MQVFSLNFKLLVQHKPQSQRLTGIAYATVFVLLFFQVVYFFFVCLQICQQGLTIKLGLGQDTAIDVEPIMPVCHMEGRNWRMMRNLAKKSKGNNFSRTEQNGKLRHFLATTIKHNRTVKKMTKQ